MTPLSGVRISWLMLARNVDFVRDASSARARASAASASRRIRRTVNSASAASSRRAWRSGRRRRMIVRGRRRRSDFAARRLKRELLVAERVEAPCAARRAAPCRRRQLRRPARCGAVQRQAGGHGGPAVCDSPRRARRSRARRPRWAGSSTSPPAAARRRDVPLGGAVGRRYASSPVSSRPRTPVSRSTASRFRREVSSDDALGPARVVGVRAAWRDDAVEQEREDDAHEQRDDAERGQRRTDQPSPEPPCPSRPSLGRRSNPDAGQSPPAASGPVIAGGLLDARAARAGRRDVGKDAALAQRARPRR